MAYYLRGIAYEQAGAMERSAEDAKPAFSLVDRVSETERTDITAYYYRSTGELDKEVDAWQLSVRNDPRNWGPHDQLSLTYIEMGKFEEELKEGQESARLEPHVEPPWRRQLDALMCLNRLPEAEAVAAKVGRWASTVLEFTSAFLSWRISKTIPRRLRGRSNGFRASPKNTSASACRRPT